MTDIMNTWHLVGTFAERVNSDSTHLTEWEVIWSDSRLLEVLLHHIDHRYLEVRDELGRCG
jgi:hypothetical protein